MGKGKIPRIDNRIKITIICEGLEEEQYLSKLRSFNRWNEKDLNIKIVNPGGISATYTYLDHDRTSGNKADYYFIFCDTGDSGKQSRIDFKEKVIDKINDDYFGKNPSKEIVIFANPCTMQIILSHFKRAHVTTEDIDTIKEYVAKTAGIRAYKKDDLHIKQLMNQINSKNYSAMKRRIHFKSRNYKRKNSTNAYKMFSRLEKKDTKWVSKAQKKIGMIRDIED